MFTPEKRGILQSRLHRKYWPRLFQGGHQNHVAEESDTSAKGLAKPLVRIRGIVWDRRRIQARTSPASNVTLTPRTKIQNPLTECVKCRASVRADKMAAHMAERCPKRQNVSRTNAKSVGTKLGESDKARRLVGNVITGGSTGPVYLKSRGTRASRFNSSSSPVGGKGEPRRLDGASDYWRFREDGRFGSHPSFDNHDDESTP